MSNILQQTPLGIFDSGVGGLFVLNELKKILPQESFVYLSDSANAPYGEKTPQQISYLSLHAGAFLVKQQVKGLIIACNTASCYGSHELRSALNIPVFDVIEPTIQFFQDKKDLTQVLLLATNATVKSQLFEKRIATVAPWVQLTSLGCPEFVSKIEDPFTTKEELHLAVEMHLSALKNHSFDAIILGCTHFLCLKPILVSLFRQTPLIVPSAELLGNYIKNRIFSFSSCISQDKFYTSGDIEKFRASLKKHLLYTGSDVYPSSQHEIFC